MSSEAWIESLRRAIGVTDEEVCAHCKPEPISKTTLRRAKKGEAPQFLPGIRESLEYHRLAKINRLTGINCKAVG